MSVRPELAFDVCWGVYRGARQALESKRGVAALNCEVCRKYSWQPDLQPKLRDWVADFALAGQAALEGPSRASRMVMFRLFYLGLSERGWVNWSEKVRIRCGEELLRRGLFPPRKYFGGGE